MQNKASYDKQQEYLNNKLNPIMQPLVRAMMKDLQIASSDPGAYIESFLAGHYGDQLAINEAERLELDHLRKVTNSGQLKISQLSDGSGETNEDKQTIDSEEDSDDEFVGNLPPG